MGQFHDLFAVLNFCGCVVVISSTVVFVCWAFHKILDIF